MSERHEQERINEIFEHYSAQFKVTPTRVLLSRDVFASLLGDSIRVNVKGKVAVPTEFWLTTNSGYTLQVFTRKKLERGTIAFHGWENCWPC